MEKIKSLLAKNWLNLKKPADYSLVSLSENTSVFQVRPLEKGFGITIGNALRRILLSSLQGTAIVAIHIDGINHEYSAISGVREDVMDIVLNLKSVVFKNLVDEKKKLKIYAEGCGPVMASAIQTVGDLEVVNRDLVICNIVDPDVKFEVDIFVNSGKGYVSSEMNKLNNEGHFSLIYIDSIFSPVKRVSYKVQNSRVGSETEFDNLYITVETNGAIQPDMALAFSAKILQDQLQTFINFADVEPIKSSEEEKLPFNPKLLIKIANLELSVRADNCLKNENIKYIGDLASKGESKMLCTPNFGKKSLVELREVLAKMDLNFGMDIPGWPPKNIEELSKKYEEEGLI